MITLLVCGGRQYDDELYLHTVMDYIDDKAGIERVVSGAADGADSFAANWARLNDVDLREYPADWRKYGMKAGPMRNQQMLDEEEITLVLAFPGGRGTDNMIHKALVAGVPVYECKGRKDAFSLDKVLQSVL